MKGLGILLIAVGLLCMATPALASLWGDDKPEIFNVFIMETKEGRSMSLYPLLGIVSFATGAALVTASIVTRKR